MTTTPPNKLTSEDLITGARIFCQERDSFGWLIGGIEYKGKKAYYG